MEGIISCKNLRFDIFVGSNPILATSSPDVLKLVDKLDLGSSAARRMGSIPFIRTKFDNLI